MEATKTYQAKDKQYTEAQLRELFKIPENVTIEGCHILANDSESIDYLKALASVKAFPVFGFGTELSKLLISDDEIFENPFKIFDSNYLTSSKLQNLGFGKTQAKSFIEGLEKTYENGIPFGLLVKTLNIDGCGKSIIEQFTRFRYNMNYSTSGMNREVWKNLTSIESTNYFIDAIQQLESYGYEVICGIEETQISEDSIKVMLTGSPKEFGFKTKGEFLSQHKNLVEVKKLQDADFLVTDDLESGSSKMKKASQLGIKVKTYGEF